MELTYSDEIWDKIIKYDSDIVLRLIVFFNQFIKINKDTIGRELKIFAEQNNIKPKNLNHLIRLVLTAQEIGPGLYDLLEVLGKDQITDRLMNIITISS